MRKAVGNVGPVALSAVALSLIFGGTAFAHLERPSYWPDPAPDTSITPAAGGGVPVAKSLATAAGARRSGNAFVVRGARTNPRTEVRVVCQGRGGRTSLRLARRSINAARTDGYQLRPSQPATKLSRRQASRLLKQNQKLRRMCRYRNVQRAVNASGNNDRIVIMPGTYTEQASRSAPENDPRCNPSLLQRDASGDATPSYEYQVTCPHDQNLIYVQGRAVVGKPLDQPRSDRRGIPEQELGPCVRCNLQIEGSGPKPEDVILDAGTQYQGSGPEARPGGYAKHVVLRADRTDGLVVRNALMRGGREHGFYTEESDGVLLDRTKFFWNADYGHLAFTSDHQQIQNCDAMGAGDAALYPGAAPETGSQSSSFYPDAPRYNTTVTRCDMRNSALGYSGSMGNAVRITNNHIYGNATGIASDTLSSAGHPGFPADGVKVDNNLIYANNFNVYADGSRVKPLVGVPVGSGILYAGMNDARVHDNYFFDNWRDATMLFAVPDALTSYGGPEGDKLPGVSCATTDQGVSTSCGNRYFDNKFGQVPAGFTFPAKLDEYGVPHGPNGERRLPNGNDIWWDEFTSNTANCWYGNSGPDGRPGSVTGPGGAGRSAASPPQIVPDCAGGSDPGSSMGAGDPAKTQYLVDCSNGPDKDTGPMDCDWWVTPARPGSAEAARQQRRAARAGRAFNASPEAARLRKRMADLVAGR
jgi:hypothetical protein